MSLGFEREFALHPDRDEVRRLIESLEVDPYTDTIILGDEVHREFLKGNLRRALTTLPLNFTTLVVKRNGKEIFRKEGIKDLFGSVFF